MHFKLHTLTIILAVVIELVAATHILGSFFFRHRAFCTHARTDPPGTWLVCFANQDAFMQYLHNGSDEQPSQAYACILSGDSPDFPYDEAAARTQHNSTAQLLSHLSN